MLDTLALMVFHPRWRKYVDLCPLMRSKISMSKFASQIPKSFQGVANELKAAGMILLKNVESWGYIKTVRLKFMITLVSILVLEFGGCLKPWDMTK